MPPTKKLLVADDSLIIQKVIRLALANEGYDIQAISDGNDAVQQISVMRPSAVLIDVTLPGRNAFDVKRAVNALPDLKDVRFILMSSAYEKVDEDQIREVVFDGRLTKPFDPPHLRQLLNSILQNVPTTQAPGSSLKGRTPPAPTAPSGGLPPLPPSQHEGLPPLPSTPPTPPAHGGLPPLPTSSAPGGLPPLPGAPGRTPPPTPGPSSPTPSLPPLPNLGTPPDPRQAPWTPAEPPQPPSYEPPPGWEPPSADSILDPIQPMEPPPIPAAGGHGLPPAPPFPHNQDLNHGADEDIKRLTESTIRMSGLDDFQWSIQEPSMRPIPSMSDIGGSTFPPADLPKFPNPYSPDEPEEPTKKIQRPATPPLPGGASSASPTSIEAILHSPEFERMVQAQVRAQLERLAQQMLPQIAENVIKQEINRLLSEMP